MRSTLEVILSALEFVRADLYTKDKSISKDERVPTVPINILSKGVLYTLEHEARFDNRFD